MNDNDPNSDAEYLANVATIPASPFLENDATEYLPAIDSLMERELAGLLRRCPPHARSAIFGVSRGESLRTMALRMGMSPAELKAKLNADPALREAYEVAESMAIAPLEDELRSRALAGADDRGSMRALEIALKAADPRYRDAASLQLTVVGAASRAEADVQNRWQPAEIAAPSGEPEPK